MTVCETDGDILVLRCVLSLKRGDVRMGGFFDSESSCG